MSAMRHLVGGISSGGRVAPSLDGRDLLIARAEGGRVFTEDGESLLDTALGYGAVLLGHAHPVVNAAVIAAVERGSMPAFAHRSEERAAAALTAATGPLDQAIFTNSGSEAVHMACRIARAVTGRRVVAKIAAGFDGWFDPVSYANAGAREALPSPGSRPLRQDVTLTHWNDPDDLARLFTERDDVAAVLVEPMLANAGCIPMSEAYRDALKREVRRAGALLIADEVLMGFRARFGLASHGMGLDPDLATLGKVIGNGFVVAGVVGREAVMRAAADGRAQRAGTYSGNPVATAAVEATLAELSRLDYDTLAARGARLRAAFETAFSARGVAVTTSGADVAFTPWLSDRAPGTYPDAAGLVRPEWTRALHLELRRAGLLMMPQAFGRLYLAAAHGDAEIAAMAAAISSAVTAMRHPG